jgi:hypothetical protein
MRSAIALAIVVLTLGANAAHADTPTPSPADPPASKITIQFIKDGAPIELLLGTAFSGVFVDGMDCTPSMPAIAVLESESVSHWPLSGGTQCSKGPPAMIRFEYTAAVARERAVHFSVDIYWTGTDVTYALDVTPLFAEGGPQRLPGTGGPPESTDGTSYGWLAGSFLAFTLASAAWTLARRSP